jgi:hypothetical protein
MIQCFFFLFKNDLSSLFSTTCTNADYMCGSISPTETTHFPCMRHCYLSDDGSRPVCSTTCQDHAESFEGLMVVFWGCILCCFFCCVWVYSSFVFYTKPGVCSVPLCSLRTPLEGHLCRVGVDEECFVYLPSESTPLSQGTCVDQCPRGTEAERNATHSTGFLFR